MHMSSTSSTALGSFKLLLSTVGVTCLSFAAAQPSNAAIFQENRDSGDTLGDAQVANTRPGGTSLSGIQGKLSVGADLFQITIRNTIGEFLASTGNQGKTEFEDTQLFLFDANGAGVFANDNTPNDDPGRANPGTGRSTIRIRKNTIPDGIYYLGISGYNYDPIDASGNLLFPNARKQMVSPLNPTARLTSWQANPGYSGPGLSYLIDLTGSEFVSLVSPVPIDPIPSPAPIPPAPIPSPIPPAPSPSPIPPAPIPSPIPPTPIPIPPTPSPSPIPPTPSPSPSPSPSPIPSPSPSPSPFPTPSPSPDEPASVPEPSSIMGLLTLVGLAAGVMGNRKSDRP